MRLLTKSTTRSYQRSRAGQPSITRATGRSAPLSVSWIQGAPKQCKEHDGHTCCENEEGEHQKVGIHQCRGATSGRVVFRARPPRLKEDHHGRYEADESDGQAGTQPSRRPLHLVRPSVRSARLQASTFLQRTRTSSCIGRNVYRQCCICGVRVFRRVWHWPTAREGPPRSGRSQYCFKLSHSQQRETSRPPAVNRTPHVRVNPAGAAGRCGCRPLRLRPSRTRPAGSARRANPVPTALAQYERAGPQPTPDPTARL